MNKPADWGWIRKSGGGGGNGGDWRGEDEEQEEKEEEEFSGGHMGWHGSGVVCGCNRATVKRSPVLP